MGEILEAACRACGLRQSLSVGQGMFPVSLEHAAGEFPEQVRTEILTYAGREQPLDYNFSWEPAVCKNCAELVCIPVLDIRPGDDKQRRRYMGGCERCKNQAEPVGETKQIRCPACKEGILEIKQVGLWD